MKKRLFSDICLLFDYARDSNFVQNVGNFGDENDKLLLKDSVRARNILFRFC